jgi:hypothetical protein
MPAGEFRLLFCVHVNAAAKNCTALLEGRNQSASFFSCSSWSFEGRFYILEYFYN